MENCLPNNDTQAIQHAQSQPHESTHHSPNWDADVLASKEAYKAWQSGDSKQIDHALDERARLSHSDPSAWKFAMKQIDQEEAQAKLDKQQAALAEAQAAEAEKARLAAATAPTKSADAAPAADAPTQVAAPVQLTDIEVKPVLQPGYAPQSPFAPAPPSSPAYDAAYNHRGAFHGLNSILKIGVQDGSLVLGVNVGLASAQASIGKNMRGEAELFPFGGPIHARAGAGIGINENGLHGEAGAGGNFFNLVGGDADVGARLGNDIGVDADARGRALIAEGSGNAGASLGDQGLRSYAGGNADVANVLGGRAGGRFSLGGDDTGVAGGAGLNVAGNTLDFGPSFDATSDGKVTTGIHLDPSKVDEATFYPTGNRSVDQQ